MHVGRRGKNVFWTHHLMRFSLFNHWKQTEWDFFLNPGSFGGTRVFCKPLRAKRHHTSDVTLHCAQRIFKTSSVTLVQKKKLHQTLSLFPRTSLLVSTSRALTSGLKKKNRTQTFPKFIPVPVVQYYTFAIIYSYGAVDSKNQQGQIIKNTWNLNYCLNRPK